MKKEILLFVIFCIISINSNAELSVTLNVETPGTLSSLIANSKKHQITSLTLTGYLNGSDIRYIREMADSYKNTSLSYLDISNANIVKGGGY